MTHRDRQTPPGGTGRGWCVAAGLPSGRDGGYMSILRCGRDGRKIPDQQQHITKLIDAAARLGLHLTRASALPPKGVRK